MAVKTINASDAIRDAVEAIRNNSADDLIRHGSSDVLRGAAQVVNKLEETSSEIEKSQHFQRLAKEAEEARQLTERLLKQLELQQEEAQERLKLQEEVEREIMRKRMEEEAKEIIKKGEKLKEEGKEEEREGEIAKANEEEQGDRKPKAAMQDRDLKTIGDLLNKSPEEKIQEGQEEQNKGKKLVKFGKEILMEVEEDEVGHSATSLPNKPASQSKETSHG